MSQTQPEACRTLDALRFVTDTEHMHLDAAAQRTLELTEAGRSRSVEGSLLGVLGQTTTPMGARLLRRRLLSPLTRPDQIAHRLDGVQCVFEADIPRARAREALRQMPDLEAGSRLAQGTSTPAGPWPSRGMPTDGSAPGRPGIP